VVLHQMVFSKTIEALVQQPAVCSKPVLMAVEHLAICCLQCDREAKVEEMGMRQNVECAERVLSCQRGTAMALYLRAA